MKNLYKAGLLCFGLILLYSLTAPANHTEAEDVFNYAWEIENKSVSQLFYTSHLLYRPMLKTVFVISKYCGYSGRVYPLMVGINIIIGSICVVLFYSLLKKITARSVSAGQNRVLNSALALGSALLMGFSYNFWRYSCEGEVYLLAMLVPLLCLHVILAERQSLRKTILLAFLGGLAVMVHIANAAFAVVAVPVYFLLRRKWRGSGTYMAILLLLLVAVYGTVAVATGFQEGSALQSQPAEAGIQPQNILRAAVAIGQCVVSGNFLFLHPAFGQWIQHRYPYRMLGEELFMGETVSMPFWLPVATLSLLAVAIAVAAIMAYANRRRHKMSWPQAVAGLLLVWVLSYAAIMLILEPGNPEIWIMLLPPLWLLAALLGRRLAASRLGVSVLFVCVALLGLHNWVGGMALLQQRGGDYNFQKSEWVLQTAREKDTVLTAGNPVFFFYLRYHCDGEVVNLNKLDISEPATLLESLREFTGEVYAFNDIFQPPPSLLKRFPSRRRRIERMRDLLEPHFSRVHSDEFGGMWRLER